MDMIHKVTTENKTSYTEMSSKPIFNTIQFQNFSLAPIITNNIKHTIDDIFDSIGIERENHLIARGSYTKGKIVSGHFIKNHEPLAIKIINLHHAPQNMMKHAKEECEAVKNLKHTGICLTFFMFNFNHSLYIIMNFAGSYTLNDEIKKHNFLPYETVAIYTCELACALHYLHKKLIAHRDLKPDNIIVRNTNNSNLSKLVLVDFGFAKKLKDQTQTCSVYCGTKAYKSPEIRSATPYNPFRSDIWSFGVIIAKLVTSKSIFSGMSNTEVITILKDKTIQFIQHGCSRSIPSCILSSLSELIHIYPWRRPNLQKIISFEWISQNNKCKDILSRQENINLFFS